jgi:hypothetical protein
VSRARAQDGEDSVWRTDPHVPQPGAVAGIDPPPVQSMVPLEVSVRLARVEVREAGTDTREWSGYV